MNKIAYRLSLFGLGICAFTLSITAHGRVVRVIHTNDLHTQMDHAYYATRGGYAALKFTMDKVKAEAKAEGIETLTLDGGDFGEGGLHYLGHQGLDPMQILNQMGLDAAVIGNHDWLMGSPDLNTVLPKVGFQYKLLGANFLQKSKKEFLREYIKPYEIFERAGLRIGVIGLTTDEFFYSWRAELAPEDKIEDPIQVAGKVVPEMRRKADFVIALTHLGTKKDIKLAQKTKGIDFIVGGHSHTCLYKPVRVENPDGQIVPIVQTGCHAEYLGVTTLDIEPGQPALVLDYKLIPIVRAEGEDPEMLKHVDQVYQNVVAAYGKDFLQEKVADSTIDLDPPGAEPTTWGRIFAEAIRTSAKAEVSFDVPMFHGRAVPAGEIKMEDLFHLYPRVFDFKDRYGWNIWTANVPGWIMDIAIRLLAMNGVTAVVGGVKVKTFFKNGKVKVHSITINGHPINPLRTYKVAFGEGIVRGADELTSLFQAILQNPKNTKKPIWLELRNYIKTTLKGKINRESRIMAKSDELERPVTFFYPNRLPSSVVQNPSGRMGVSSVVDEAFTRPDPETICNQWTEGDYFSRDFRALGK